MGQVEGRTWASASHAGSNEAETQAERRWQGCYRRCLEETVGSGEEDRGGVTEANRKKEGGEEGRCEEGSRQEIGGEEDGG
jgi:hypothetical protein